MQLVFVCCVLKHRSIHWGPGVSRMEYVALLHSRCVCVECMAVMWCVTKVHGRWCAGWVHMHEYVWPLTAGNTCTCVTHLCSEYNSGTWMCIMTALGLLWGKAGSWLPTGQHSHCKYLLYTRQGSAGLGATNLIARVFVDVFLVLSSQQNWEHI